MKKIIFIVLLITHYSLYNIHCFGQWVKTSGPPEGSPIFALTKNSTYIFAGTLDSGIYNTTNSGDNWIHTSFSNFPVRSITANGMYVFAGTDSGVYVSSNNGYNWSISLDSEFCWSIITDTPKVFAGMAHQGVYATTNNGVNWTQTSLTLGVITLASSKPMVFAGIGFPYGVYRSTDFGLTWNLTPLIQALVRPIAISDSNIFVGTSYYGLYLSTNNGENWSQIFFNNRVIWALALSGQCIFVGTEVINDIGGVYLSFDNGQIWHQKNEGFYPLTSVNSLLIKDNYIFAGTEGNSVWRRSLQEIITGIGKISQEELSGFELFQNYPNPFNPTTQIKYGIPNDGFVSLKVYDILGREVKLLVNEYKKAGYYEANFNASNLPSGMYLYRIYAGDYNAVKKMVLVK